MGNEIEDPLLMVYDMRMMKLGLPVRCALPPYLLRFVPNFSSVLAVVTSGGLWNTIDIMHPETALLMLHNNGKQVRHANNIWSYNKLQNSQLILSIK